jgi:hypothetical protein
MVFMRARHLEPTERAMQWPDAKGALPPKTDREGPPDSDSPAAEAQAESQANEEVA